ncbi:hypothetical protein DUI87_02488 [Hirundo rustica rustica]|uniref:Uncharacterized protein n=1 Tax=Hirundo rustica rustica TaxID=333673 RepID=A0A3M0L929_HIRRU|nr:hypothetical protein DUI87_02488 [Hirundo rustica rustica]
MPSRYVGTESISISGVTGGSQQLTVLEAEVSLTGNGWQKHPIVTGPEAPCILGIDYLRNGYFKDPKGYRWAFGIAAVETEDIRQLSTLPGLSDDSCAVGLLRVEEQQVPIATTTVHRRQYRTDRDSVIPIHEMIRKLESQGVVSKARSPFNSPIWPVRKSSGEWRLTVDYRALNEVTPPLSAAVPDMLELQYELESKAAKGMRVWSPTRRVAQATEGQGGSSQVAELKAIQLALDIAEREKWPRLYLYTDSWMVANALWGWLNHWKKANWQRRGKPIWAAEIWQDIAARVEKLTVKVRHVDAHVSKSQANEEHHNNEQVDKAAKVKVSQVDLDWQHKGEVFLARWAHDASGHQGRDATYRWARDRGVDLTMDNISQVIHNCETCAAIKQAKRVKPLWYGGRWLKYRYGEAWQIDYITLPQTRQGKRYVLTMVEATTGWLETYPVPHATARNTILGLEKQVLWRHGTPERIESDNGTHFKNGLINTWAREHGIEWIYHIPYHAPAAGKVERCNGLLKTTLKALGGGTFKNWELNLAKAAWMVNTRGSVNRAGPAQSEPLHTVDGDKVPVVHMKGILGKTVWINPTSSKGRPIRGIVFAQGPGSTCYRGQISVHAPSHKLLNEEFHLIPHEKRSRRPLKALTVFTDASRASHKSVMTWRNPQTQRWEADVEFVEGSPQVAELAAVVRAFEKFSEPINLVTDSAYVAGVVFRAEQAVLKEIDNEHLFRLLSKLIYLISHREHPFYVMHVRSHTDLPGEVAEGNRQADSLAAPVENARLPDIFQQAKLSHQQYHQNVPGLIRQFQLTRSQARAIVATCPNCQVQAMPSMGMGVNPQGLGSCEVWQTDITHIPSFGHLKYVHVSIDTHSGAVYASAHAGEKTERAKKHLVQAFSVLGIPKEIKTDNGPAYTSKGFLEFLQQWGVEHKTGIPHSPTGQAVVERAHQTLKQVLARQSSTTVWMSPHEKLCKAMFTINFLNCSFENMSPPVVRHFNSGNQFKLSQRPPVMIRDPETWETKEKAYLTLNPVMNPIQVVILLLLNSLAAAWIIPQPRQNVWVTLAQTLPQENICLSTASTENPMSTCLRGVQYTWNQLPQGWKHSPTICHGLIQTALEKSEAPEHLQYIDDIIVWGNTAAEVFEKGKEIIQILLEAGFAIKKSKVKGPAHEIQFLGVKWQDGRRQIPTEVINKITAMSPPMNKKETQAFLSAIGFWRMHIPQYSQIVSPLYLVTCKKNDFHWGPEQQQAFAQIKQEIAHAVALGPVRTRPDVKNVLYSAAENNGLSWSL